MNNPFLLIKCGDDYLTIIIPTISKIEQYIKYKNKNYSFAVNEIYELYFVKIYCGTNVTLIECKNKEEMIEKRMNIEQRISQYYE